MPDIQRPAAWIDESVSPVPKNMYGVTKAAAEDLCQLAHRNHGLPSVELRVARFFPEGDDRPDAHEGRADAAAVFARRAPRVAEVWARRGWRFPTRIDRVYDNTKARADLGWHPRYDLTSIAELVDTEDTVQTPLARLVGSKEYLHSPYHRGTFVP
ncbi:NAD-dependent epimerase/dehydratase family protein [Mycolicibacterium sp. 050232]|uniref:NAD-dependent epimerase/dehydratase family protein n=1 Tax=Mycolicibacterium sp. 050232 TaxID=3113982 RepID=UPI002E2DA090|nr:NAD-dependent epimerase/dehydratase family protein [Mycolicibacterium sp. 050232]MED5815402.1 NAD-dependent epimerase/dehydratase family protein [Mycolicibacterium sp. 050232]